jgi:3-oxoacyl-[acyl-carrier protein] reductase
MIVITGASRGIGLAIAQRLKDSGQEVLGIARSCQNLDFPSAECDVVDSQELGKVAREIRASGSKVTSLINAAGIASMNLALTAPPDQAAAIVNTNLLGTIYSCQAFSPLMIRQRYGRIINFSSIAVPLGIAGESIYSASKAGVEAFSRSFAKEISPLGITVNCIAPGPIATDMMRGVSEEQILSIVNRQVIRKQFTTDDICDLVELLLDHKSGAMSGQVVNVGGV